MGFASVGNPRELIYKALYGFFLLYKYFSPVTQPGFFPNPPRNTQAVPGTVTASIVIVLDYNIQAKTIKPP
jgi:hypothetical protein